MTDLFPQPQAPVPTRASRSASRRRAAASAAARRRRRRRRSVVLALSLVLVVGAGWYVAQHLPEFSFGGESASDYEGPGTGSVEVTVAKGDTGQAIGQTLQEAGVVKSVKAFTAAYSKNPSASKIQPGVFALRKEMKASDAVSLLASGSTRVENTVTIPEGFTVAQVVARVAERSDISKADLEQAMKDTKATGLPAEAGKSYEGWLFPATYEIDPGTTATSLLAQMVAKTVSVLDANDVPRSEREDLLTKASIAQKEAGKADYGKVVRVIDNRLAPGSPTGGRLEMDTILAYGLGKTQLEFTKAELADASSPYNSRLHAGLPPTPISNPGEEVIKAAIDPPHGDWIYFVTVDPDTGETLFTSDYQEFLKGREQFKAWLAANPQD